MTKEFEIDSSGTVTFVLNQNTDYVIRAYAAEDFQVTFGIINDRGTYVPIRDNLYSVDLGLEFGLSVANDGHVTWNLDIYGNVQHQRNAQYAYKLPNNTVKIRMTADRNVTYILYRQNHDKS